MEIDFGPTQRVKKEREDTMICGGLIEFNPNNHRYRNKTTGKYYYSVSSVANMLDKGEGFNKWIAKCGEEYLMEFIGFPITHDLAKNASKAWEDKRNLAGHQGTTVHDYAEEYSKSVIEGRLRKPFDSNDNAIIAGVNAFEMWRIENKVKFVSAEKICCSHAFKYAGRYDGIIDIDGEDVLVDYKTSSGIKLSHLIQAGGYVYAINEEREAEGQPLVRKAVIVHLNKDTGEYKEYVLEDKYLSLATTIFLSLVNIKTSLKMLNKPFKL